MTVKRSKKKIKQIETKCGYEADRILIIEAEAPTPEPMISAEDMKPCKSETGGLYGAQRIRTTMESTVPDGLDGRWKEEEHLVTSVSEEQNTFFQTSRTDSAWCPTSTSSFFAILHKHWLSCSS